MSTRKKRSEEFAPPYDIQAELEVDFDAEEVRDRKGNPITSESVAATVDHVYAKMKLGRPSLDRGKSGRSPQRAVRLPEALDAALASRAKREGRSVSEVMREAIEAYVGR